MRNMVCVSTCAIWSKGKVDKKCGFYADGRFNQTDFDNNVVYIIENTRKDHILAVFENFELENSEKNISICLPKELMRFQNHCENNSKSIDIKLEDLCDTVNQTSNLIHSLEISNGKKMNNSLSRGTACVLLAGKQISAVTCGQARAYLYSEGALKVLNEDLLKAERLIRAGVISNKQALDFEGKYVAYKDEIRRDIKKSSLYPVKEGDSILLCNSDLLNVLDEDVVLSILSNNNSSTCALAKLVEKAREKGCDSELSIIICKIEKMLNNFQCSECKMNDIDVHTPLIRSHSDNLKQKSTKNYSKKRSIFIKAALVVIFILLIFQTAKTFDVSNIAIKFVQPIINTFFVTSDKEGKNIGVLPPQTAVPDNNLNPDLQELQTNNNVNNDLDDKDKNENNANENIENDQHINNNIENSNIQRKYIVKRGDTLEKISKVMYNDPSQYKKIMEANNIKSPEKIKVGQELIIP